MRDELSRQTVMAGENVRKWNRVGIYSSFVAPAREETQERIRKGEMDNLLKHPKLEWGWDGEVDKP